MGRVIRYIRFRVNKLRNKISSRHFNEDQIKEIELGLVENLDVECYAKECFDEHQMREIRYGLEEGLNINCYAKKHYNFNQMREIRLMLEKSK